MKHPAKEARGLVRCSSQWGDAGEPSMSRKLSVPPKTQGREAQAAVETSSDTALITSPTKGPSRPRARPIQYRSACRYNCLAQVFPNRVPQRGRLNTLSNGSKEGNVKRARIWRGGSWGVAGKASCLGSNGPYTAPTRLPPPPPPPQTPHPQPHTRRHHMVAKQGQR